MKIKSCPFCGSHADGLRSTGYGVAMHLARCANRNCIASFKSVDAEVWNTRPTTSETFGPCARRVVTCTLVTPNGDRVIGTNWCANPQPICPRTEGEGYEKCKTVCRQIGHAEEDALRIAGDAARGSHAYVENHTYACRNCQEALFAAGVAALTIGPPP